MSSSLPWVTNDVNPDQTLTVGQGDARYQRAVYTRKAIADANYTILNTDRYVAMTSLTATRQWALPLANTFPTGVPLYCVDESGQILVGTRFIQVNRSGADTLNGALNFLINYAFTTAIFFSDGVSKWYAILLPTAGLSDPLSNGIVKRIGVGTAAQATPNVDYLVAQYTSRGDANYSLLGTDRYVAVTAALTAPRVFTLLGANNFLPGTVVCVADQFGGVTGTNKVSFARSGGDLINGAAANFDAITNAFGVAFAISDGSSNWTVYRIASSLADPGANGIMKRTSLGVTAAAVLADLYATIGPIANSFFIIGPTAGGPLNPTARLLAYQDFVNASLIGTAASKIAAGDDARFTDARQCNNTFLNANTARIALVPASANISASDIDWSTGDNFTKSLVANTTFTFSNMVDGEVITVTLTQGASWTVTWPTVKWPGGTPPVMTTGAAKIDIYTFKRVGAVTYGTFVQNMA